MSLPEFLFDVVLQFVIEAAGVVLEWFAERGRRFATLFRRERRS